MCGRYGGPKGQEIYAGYLPVEQPFKNMRPRPEYALKQMAPVFARNSKGEITLQEMRFGLIPSTWTGTLKAWRYDTHNARLESIDTNRSFALAWRRKRRAVVPASYISEWFNVVDAPSGKLSVDLRRADGQDMGVAALWDYAPRTADGPILSFSLITREPGARLKPFHPREVCVLEPDLWLPYLQGGDIDLKKPWADDGWLIGMSSSSQKKIAQAPVDLFAVAAE